MDGPNPRTFAAEYAVEPRLVRELVIVSGLPEVEQPVDPHTYGTGPRAAR
jgi:hypothetical protein